MEYGKGSYGGSAFAVRSDMTDDIQSLVPSRTLSRLRGTYRRGMRAVQLWNDTPIVTIMRDSGDGYAPVPDLTDLHVIRVGVNNSLPNVSPPNQGAVEVRSRGELKAWSPVDLRIDDRFWWGDQLCQITSVDPEKLETVTVASFDIVQGRRM